MLRRSLSLSGLFMPLRIVGLSVIALHVGFFISSSVHADTSDTLAVKLNQLGYTAGDTTDRVRNHQVNGWNYIDDKHIVIYAGPSQRFLITTMIECPDLNFAEHIGFTSTASYISKLDKLIVRGTDRMVRHCPIAEIKVLKKINRDS